MISGIFIGQKGCPKEGRESTADVACPGYPRWRPGKLRLAKRVARAAWQDAQFPGDPAIMRAPIGEPPFPAGEMPVAKAAASSPAEAGTSSGRTLDPLDLYGVRAALSEEERLVQESVARLVDAEVLPIIQRCFEEHRFQKELIPQLAAQGLLGSSIQGYDCAGLNAVSYGLICQELERGDSGIRSFVSVQ